MQKKNYTKKRERKSKVQKKKNHNTNKISATLNPSALFKQYLLQ